MRTGAEYHPIDGAFKWVSDDTSIEFNDWKKGEPRFGMDCAIMLNRKNWGTDQCAMERNYICKKGNNNINKLSKSTCIIVLVSFAASTYIFLCAVLKQSQNFVLGTSFLFSELRGYVMPKVELTDKTSKYKWYAGAWGKCSVTCGGGQRNRKTYCSLGPNGAEVHYSKCKGKTSFSLLYH